MNTEKRISWHYNPEGLSAIQQKLHPLLLNEEPAMRALDALDETEQAELSKMLACVIDELNVEHTRLMVMMAKMAELPNNQLIWENNHLKVTRAIISALSHTGSMPNQMYLAKTTGLSRKTVRAHMAQGDDRSIYAEHLRQYTMMSTQVMDVVLQEAVLEHNMKAAKLYFDILEKLKAKGPSAIYNTSNNYIQINNTVIKQEIIGLLAPEQLRKIEELLAEWLPFDPNESIFGPDVPPVGFSKP